MDKLYKNVNGERIEMTPEEVNERLKESAEYLKRFERQRYKDLRKDNYPPVEEQLDLIYHGGMAAWKARIKEIKDKYPKPK